MSQLSPKIRENLTSYERHQIEMGTLIIPALNPKQNLKPGEIDMSKIFKRVEFVISVEQTDKEKMDKIKN